MTSCSARGNPMICDNLTIMFRLSLRDRLSSDEIKGKASCLISRPRVLEAADPVSPNEC